MAHAAAAVANRRREMRTRCTSNPRRRCVTCVCRLDGVALRRVAAIRDGVLCPQRPVALRGSAIPCRHRCRSGAETDRVGIDHVVSPLVEAARQARMTIAVLISSEAALSSGLTDPPVARAVDEGDWVSGIRSLHWTISEQFFAEHPVSAGSNPSYRHEEPASPTTWVTLLTGGLLVRVQPEEPNPQSLQ